MVAKMVESGKKFEIKFAEKKKKENYIQTIIEKSEVAKEKPVVEQPMMDMMKMFAMFTKFQELQQTISATPSLTNFT